MTDSKQILWEFLTAADTTLYGLVATRVWSPRAPEGWRNTSAAVIYDVNESAHATGAVSEVLITANCYGGTLRYGDADAVYRALYDRLHGAHGKRCASGTLHAAYLVSGSVGDREIETEWPFAAATYRVITSG